MKMLRWSPRLFLKGYLLFFSLYALNANAENSSIIVKKDGTDITTTASGWSVGSSSGSLANAPVVSLNPTALEFDYNLGSTSGSYVIFTSPNLEGTVDISNFNAFQFYMKGNGRNNRLSVEVTDSNNNFSKSTTLLNTLKADWEKIILPFADFSNSLVNFQSVKKIGFTVEPDLTTSDGGGTGTVLVDELEAIVSATPTPVTSPTPTPTPMVIDRCENDKDVNGYVTNDLNSLGGILGNTLTASFDRVSSPVPAEGSYCRRMRNTDTNSGNGMWNHIYRNDQTSQLTDAGAYSHLSFYLQTSNALTGDLNMELVDMQIPSKRSQVRLNNYLGASDINKWVLVQVPLTAFGNQIDRTQLGELNFILPGNTTIYLDDIEFIYSSTTSTAVTTATIDTMDTYYTNSSWQTNVATNTLLNLSTVPGKVGNALQLDYQFPPNPQQKYVNVYRGFGLNVLESGATAFRFNYMGDAEQKNRLEFKLYDGNVTYWVYFNDIADSNQQWKSIDIPFSNFREAGTTGQAFNFKNIQTFQFAVSAGFGGNGKLFLSSIEYFKQDSYSKPAAPQDLITQFAVDNNPFSPQTDPLHSTAKFRFQVNELAEVSLSIYSLSGREITKLKKNSVSPGVEQNLIWDGMDSKGKVVRNGMYLYQFIAKGQQRTQRIRNIIGVIR